MPRFIKDGLTIETAIATEAAELRRDGFTEQKARTSEVRAADAATAAKSAEQASAAAASPAKPSK